VSVGTPTVIASAKPDPTAVTSKKATAQTMVKTVVKPEPMALAERLKLTAASHRPTRLKQVRLNGWCCGNVWKQLFCDDLILSLTPDG
jgi:hypothetical protein